MDRDGLFFSSSPQRAAELSGEARRSRTILLPQPALFTNSLGFVNNAGFATTKNRVVCETNVTLLLARPAFTVATNKPRICSDPLTVAKIGDSAQISELARFRRFAAASKPKCLKIRHRSKKVCTTAGSVGQLSGGGDSRFGLSWKL